MTDKKTPDVPWPIRWVTEEYGCKHSQIFGSFKVRHVREEEAIEMWEWYQKKENIIKSATIIWNGISPNQANEIEKFCKGFVESYTKLIEILDE